MGAQGGHHERMLVDESCDRHRLRATPVGPWLAARLDPAIAQLVPTAYRRPSQLDAGGVLVVGASAQVCSWPMSSSRAGRDVTITWPPYAAAPRLSRRRHPLVARRMGIFDETIGQVLTSRSRVISLRCNWWGIPIA
jgi:hypothetical protein